MAINITEENWRAIQSATRLPSDLCSLMQLMRDNRASEHNVRLSLEQIREHAQFVADFCTAAIKRI